MISQRFPRVACFFPVLLSLPDAGSTGLNLQVASTLINMDLPWNPAVLEQRIARIFRLGQEKPVQIINLVSKGSIEEGMINKLRFKKSMFEGVLDGGADTVFVDESKFKKLMDDLAVVMEATPDAPEVEYVDEEVEQEQKGKTSVEASLDEALADASEADDESSVDQESSVDYGPSAEYESSADYESLATPLTILLKDRRQRRHRTARRSGLPATMLRPIPSN